jgi:hypothetical protein
MRKRDELTDPASCLNRAHGGEMVFVLLGRDEDAPDTIRDWIKRRIRRGKNQPGDPQMLDAEACARTMEAERARARPPIADWPLVDGYSCRACGQPARANPRDGREWGCAGCNGSSHSLILNFTRDADPEPSLSGADFFGHLNDGGPG